MSTFEQTHNGIGDNVRDKIYLQISGLAPSDLSPSMDLVFKNIRKKDRVTAKSQIAILKTMAKDAETAALVEVISIYGELTEPEDFYKAWGVVSNIAAATSNDIVKDLCLATLLKMSFKTDQELAAVKHYHAIPAPGAHAREVFLRFYANETQLEAASQQFALAEGELTGVIEGCFRLELISKATQLTNLLSQKYPSYNSAVLEAFASAYDLNKDIAHCHLWLNSPEVKQQLDELTKQVIELLQKSKGTDVRLFDMACPIYETYQGLAPKALVEALKQYIDSLAPTYPEVAAKLKAKEGAYSRLPQLHQELSDAHLNPLNRTEWCRSFIAESQNTLESVISFTHLATSTEIGEWLLKNTPIIDASEVQSAFVRLLGCVYQNARQGNDRRVKYYLSQQVDSFISNWGDNTHSIMPELIFELAEKLCYIGLPHKALDFTSRQIPDHSLWPSPFVLTHLSCLLEAEQYKTFDEVASRVSETIKPFKLMNLQSLKAERMGDITAAIEISDQLIIMAPDLPYCWYRGCYLRYHFQSEADQQEFQCRIPSSILENHSKESEVILRFLAIAGNFKRAEPYWIQWFIGDPRKHAVALVDFHFGVTISSANRVEFDVSNQLEQCRGAIHYEQNDNPQIKLIVNDNLELNEYTLNSSSPLAKLLQGLSIGESDSLGMVNYKLVEHLPPYVACLRIALLLRHTHNDGSDTFAMLKLPSDTEQLVPFLEQKLRQDKSDQSQKFNNLPLYILGHALYPNDAFKAALNCWTDVNIPKTLLFNNGESAPKSVVLDAYGVSYLAVTNLVNSILETGVSLVLPGTTKDLLSLWIKEITHENLLLLDVNRDGKLFRTTATDIQERNGHILSGLRLVLENAIIAHPGSHDIPIEIYSLKYAMDSTVYDAIQLSFANNIPWLCMDETFANLHHSQKHPIANVQEIIIRAMKSPSRDFYYEMDGFLLYALGALHLPITYREIHYLAVSQKTTATFSLYKIIKNHGRQLFMGDNKPLLLLEIIFEHLNSRLYSVSRRRNLFSYQKPCSRYSSHIFNHGITLYLECDVRGTAELRLATAIIYIKLLCREDRRLFELVLNNFIKFAEGHFMDIEAITSEFQSLSSYMGSTQDQS